VRSLGGASPVLRTPALEQHDMDLRFRDGAGRASQYFPGSTYLYRLRLCIKIDAKIPIARETLAAKIPRRIEPSFGLGLVINIEQAKSNANANETTNGNKYSSFLV
jgi:hypothetical protein